MKTMLADGTFQDETVLTGSNVADSQTPWTPGMLYNGATNDKPRGNSQGTLLASAARTVTTTTPNQTNHNARGLVVTLDITVSGGTGGLAILLLYVDPVTGKAKAISAGPTPLIPTGTYNFIYYPSSIQTTGLASTFNAFSYLVPRTFSVQVAHSDATSYTYSLGYSLIL